jgi:Transposase, Mutator family.
MKEAKGNRQQATGDRRDEWMVQLCIVHLIRNCLRSVPWKDSKAVAAELKPIIKRLPCRGRGCP